MIHQVHIARITGVFSAGVLMSGISAAQSFPLDSISGLQPHDVMAAKVEHVF